LKNPGENMGIRVVIDKDYNFELGKTAILSVRDKFSKEPIPITDIKLTTTLLESESEAPNAVQRILNNLADAPNLPSSEKAKNTQEVTFKIDYCFDITIQLELYDSVDENQKSVARTLEVEYTGAEYCGIADAKANQATFSTVAYYSMMAGPFISLVLPSFISKF
jgi:hypothetical protein